MQDETQSANDGENDTQLFVESKYPLPEELSAMEKDDTVCQYCGIPYLIHTEVSRMKKRVAELESDLVEHKQCNSLRRLMEKDLEELQRDNLDYRTALDKALLDYQIGQTEIASLSTTIERLNEQVNQLNNQMQQQSEEKERKICEISVTLDNSRAECQALKEDTKRQQIEVARHLSNAIKQAEHEAKQQCSLQLAALKEELHGKHQKEVREMEQKLTEESIKFTRLSEEFESFKIHSAKDMDEQRAECEEKSAKIKELILQTENSESTCDKAEKLLQQTRNDLTEQREECRKLRCKLEVANQEKQRESEKLKSEIMGLRKDMENAIGQMGSEKESQLNKVQDRLLAAENDLILAKRTIRELEVDRDKTVEAHQNRIKDLQDHFREELANTCQSEVKSNLDELRKTLEQDHEAKTEHEKLKIRMEFEMQIKELKTTIEDRDLDLISAKDALKYHQNRSRELKENIKAEFEHKMRESQDEIKRLRRIVDGRKAAEEIQRIVSEKDKQIEALKRTVHRECEERNHLLVRLKNLIDAKNNSISVSLPTINSNVMVRPQRTGGTNSRNK